MITDTQQLTSDRVIHQFMGKASNFYIIEDNRQRATFLIDCGMPSDTKALFDFLRHLPPLRRIVCTHFHVDHVSGWISLKKVFENCEIWFHEKARPFIMGYERIPCPAFNDFVEMILPCMKESGYFPRPGELFKGALYGTPFKRGFPGDRVKFFANEDQVLPGFATIQTPGHRPESVSFFDQDSGILVSGDFLVVVNGHVIKNTFVASRKDQEDSITKIKSIKGIRFIYPGHGICRPFSVNAL